MSNQTHPTHLAILDGLRQELTEAQPRSPSGGERKVGELAVERYLSPARFERERAGIFARAPSVVGLASELGEAGACLPVSIAGVPVVLTRDAGGVLHAHRNACRHRATQLVAEPCTKKALVCPYHGWTYDLAGKLIHVPHEDTFLGRAYERPALAPAYVAERHGLLFASLAPFDLGAHLGVLDEEIGALRLDTEGAIVRRKHVRDVHANWKLIVDLFVESYHFRQLHRDSVYRFFFDGRSHADPVGPHIRGLTPRRSLAAAHDVALDDLDLRAVTSPSYVLFPNTILIYHPDYLSVLTLDPTALDRTRVTHFQSLPRAPATAAEEEHFQKSFDLIDGVLLGREDLMAAEAMQHGLAARADETMLIGDLEQPMLWFHATVDRALDA